MQLSLFQPELTIALCFIDKMAEFQGVSPEKFISDECRGYGMFINFPDLSPYRSISFFPDFTCDVDGCIISLKEVKHGKKS